MRALYILFGIAIPFLTISQNYNMSLLDTVEFPGQDLANIWGYASGGKEYALVGAADGLYIIDVTIQTAPVRIEQLTDGISSSWREIKTFGNYAYVTSEGLNGSGDGGIGIANLAGLPTTPVPFQKYTGDGTINDDLHRSHSLDIDEAQGYAYIYGCTGLANGGAVCLNLNNDPYNPEYAGMYNGSYIHDGYTNNNTMYGSHIYGGYFSIIDFTNKTSPTVTATQTTPNSFTHNTWPTDDGNYLLTTDEKGNSFLAMYDISDPNNITETDRIQATPGSNSIVHNTYVVGDHAVTSWYRDGVTVTDISRPDNIIQVARYDTYTFGSGYGFQGCWGVYPYLPSGVILASNMNQSLASGGTGGVMYILSTSFPDACFVEGNITDQTTGDNLFGVSVEIDHTDPLNNTTSELDGSFATGQPTTGTYDVTFTKSGYVTKTESVSFSAGAVTNLNVQLQQIALPLEMTSFTGRSSGKHNLLEWTTASEVNTDVHEIQRKGNPNEKWETFGKVNAMGNSDSETAYSFLDENPFLSTQYRIKSIDLDGTIHYSEVVIVERLDEQFSIQKIFPIPNEGNLNLTILSDDVREGILMIGNLSGQLLLERDIQIQSGKNDISLELPSDWANGQYWLRLDGKDRVLQEMFLLER